MAKKDWKKVGNDAYRNKDKLLEIHTNKTKTMPNQKEWKYSYDVAVYRNGENQTSNAIFMTKSQALKFARNYMRNN